MINPNTFRAALKTLLDARQGLIDISARVFRYPPGKLADRRYPTLWFGALTDVAQEDQSLVGDQSAVYQLSGGGYAAGSGTQDAQWGNAEALAYTLISELSDAFEGNSTVGGANHARLTSWTMEPTQDDQGNVYFDIDFTITAQYWS